MLTTISQEYADLEHLTLKEVTPNVGDWLGPNRVRRVGPGPLFSLLWGITCIPTGTVCAYEDDDNQLHILNDGGGFLPISADDLAALIASDAAPAA